MKHISNEDKAKEIIKMSNTKQVYDIVDFPSLEEALREDLMQMAQWKDERIKELEETLKCRSKYERIYRNDALKTEKEALINKACEWLEDNAINYVGKDGITAWRSVFADFRKAMKGE